MNQDVPEVEKRTPCQVRIDESVIGILRRRRSKVDTELCLRGTDLTDLAAREDLLQFVRVRLEPQPDGLHEEQVLGASEVDERLSLLRRHHETLLAEDVLARLEGVVDVAVMVRMGRSNVDDIDVLPQG